MSSRIRSHASKAFFIDSTLTICLRLAQKSSEAITPSKAKEPAPSCITYKFSGPVGQLIAGEGRQ
jgi:hypothetical protein